MGIQVVGRVIFLSNVQNDDDDISCCCHTRKQPKEKNKRESGLFLSSYKLADNWQSECNHWKIFPPMTQKIARFPPHSPPPPPNLK
jgi:hypothetical protein